MSDLVDHVGTVITRPLAVDAVPYAADGHPAYVYLAGLAPGSRRAIARQLDVIARVLGTDSHHVCPWHRLEPAHVAVVRSHLEDHCAPATGRQGLSALRGVIRACWRLRLVDGDTMARLVDFRGIAGTSEPAGHALSREDLVAVLRTCMGDGVRSRRDAALLGVMLLHGLRRTEVAALTVGSVRSDAMLVVPGKGRKVRLVPLTSMTMTLLSRWLEVRAAAQHEDALYTSVSRGDRPGSALTVTGIRAVCERVAIAAGVEVFSPHDSRRTCATTLLASSVDLASVARLLGHASLETTRRYDRRDVDQLRTTLETFAAPLASTLRDAAK